MKRIFSATLAVTLAAFMAASAVMPADAAASAPRRRAPLTSAYDGLWSVSIVTVFGDCDRGYRYPLRITGGHVGKADDDSSYAVAGAVGRGGAIGVTVSGGGQTATGRGRLWRNQGRGVWKTSNGRCSGRWTAERRDQAAR
jgi:hypothetical protein